MVELRQGAARASASYQRPEVGKLQLAWRSQTASRAPLGSPAVRNPAILQSPLPPCALAGSAPTATPRALATLPIPACKRRGASLRCGVPAHSHSPHRRHGPDDPVRVEHADAQPVNRLQRKGPPLQTPVPQAPAQVVEWCSLTPASIFVCIFLYIFLVLVLESGRRLQDLAPLVRARGVGRGVRAAGGRGYP